MNSKSSLKKRAVSFIVAFAMVFGGVFSSGFAVKVFADGNSAFDEPAKPETLQKLEKMADETMKNQDVYKRFQGTRFMHEIPQKHPSYSFENDANKIPTEVIGTTAWYQVWYEASRAKFLKDTYTDALANNAIGVMGYYNAMFGFPIGKDLKQDGLYNTSFNAVGVKMVGEPNIKQNLYQADSNEKAEVEAAFRKNSAGKPYVAIEKAGNNYTLSFMLDTSKARAIKFVSVNNIVAVEVSKYTGTMQNGTPVFEVTVPGELGPDQLVISDLSYETLNGDTVRTGPFGIKVDYKNAKFDSTYDGEQTQAKAKALGRIQNWIERAYSLKQEILKKGRDDADITKMDKVISDLETLYRAERPELDKMYEIAEPVYTIENKMALIELINKKIEDCLEGVAQYKDYVYTPESIEKYKKYLVEDIHNEIKTADPMQMVEMLAKLDNHSINTILKYNTKELEDIVKKAEEKKEADYTPATWQPFYIAKSNAKGWIEQLKKFSPAINNTSTYIKELVKAMNNLVRKDGQSEPKVEMPDHKPKPPVDSGEYKVQVLLVNRGSQKPYVEAPSNKLIKREAIYKAEPDKKKYTVTLEAVPWRDTGSTSDDQVIKDIEYPKSGTYINAEKSEQKQTNMKFRGAFYEERVDYHGKLTLQVNPTVEKFKVTVHYYDSSLQKRSVLPTSIVDVDLYVDYDNKVPAGGASSTLDLTKLNEVEKYYNDITTKANYKSVPESQLKDVKAAYEELVRIKAAQNASQQDLASKVGDFWRANDRVMKGMPLWKLEKSLKEENKAWQTDNRYTQESLAKVREIIERVSAAVTGQNVLNDSEIESNYRALSNVKNDLKFVMNDLKSKIQEAEQKSADTQYNQDSRRNLNDWIRKAKEYIDHHEKGYYGDEGTKVYDQRDRREYFISKLNLAISDLKTGGGSVGPGPVNPPHTVDKIYTVTVRFKDANSPTKDSHANGSLVGRAKYVEKSDGKFLTLKMKPMYNSGRPSGILKQLFYYPNNDKSREKIEAQYGNMKTINMSLDGSAGKQYTYPETITIPVDGRTSPLNLSTVSDSPVFEGSAVAHEHPVLLNIEYAGKSEGYSDNEVDKAALTDLLNRAKTTYPPQKSIYSADVWQKFERVLNEAQVVHDSTSSDESAISDAYNKLSKMCGIMDVFSTLAIKKANAEAGVKSDEKTGKYTADSIAKAKEFIRNTDEQVKNMLNQDNPDLSAARELVNGLDRVYMMMRFDTTKIEQKIAEANERLKNPEFTKESLRRLQTAIEEALQYISDSKVQKGIDMVDKHVNAIQNAIASLQPDNVDEVADSVYKLDLLLAVEAVKLLLEKPNVVGADELRKALVEAEAVYKNNAATKRQVNEQILKLMKATRVFNEANKPKPPVPPTPPAPNPGGTPPPSGGGGIGGIGGIAPPAADKKDEKKDEKKLDETKPVSFVDVSSNDWFAKGVLYVASKNIMSGIGNNRFAPEVKTTRAMFVTMIYRMEKEPKTELKSFSDVGGGSWYEKAVSWTTKEGIAKGASADTFMPGENISRQELVAMLYRYASYKKYSVDKKADLSGFADGNLVADWAKDATGWAVANNLIKGKDGNKIDPSGYATRAEIATIIERFDSAFVK